MIYTNWYGNNWDCCVCKWTQFENKPTVYIIICMCRARFSWSLDEVPKKLLQNHNFHECVENVFTQCMGLHNHNILSRGLHMLKSGPVCVS